jgi:hypothetical protein
MQGMPLQHVMVLEQVCPYCAHDGGGVPPSGLAEGGTPQVPLGEPGGILQI